MKFLHILAAAAVASGLSATAQTTPSTPTSGADEAVHPAESLPQSEGEVRKVDKEQAKVTLRHGPLQNLNMPAMTMVFKTADPKLLGGIKEGDKVRFTAEKVNGGFVVTAIEAL